MRLPPIYCLPVLAIGLAAPIYAQESDTTETDTPIPTFSASPRLSTEIETPATEIDAEAAGAISNDGAGAAIEANAVEVTTTSPLEQEPSAEAAEPKPDEEVTETSAGAEQTATEPSEAEQEGAATEQENTELGEEEQGDASVTDTAASELESSVLEESEEEFQPDLSKHQYQVEVVVFMRLDPSTRHSENWPENPGRADVETASAIDALQPVANAEQLKLTDSFQRLQSSPQYQTLLHSHWQQPAQHRDSPVPVQVIDNEEVNGVSPLPAFTTNSSNAASTVWPVILGTVAIAENRHLHANIDLLLTELTSVPADSANADDLSGSSYFSNQGYDDDALPLAAANEYDSVIPDSNAFKLAHYRMQHQKRIEPGKLHYFDHPVFGVLLHIELLPTATTAIDPTSIEPEDEHNADSELGGDALSSPEQPMQENPPQDPPANSASSIEGSEAP